MSEFKVDWIRRKLIDVQIGVYHHVTGVDASSSASLAAYINTLTYKENHQSSTKIVEGIYWYAGFHNLLENFTNWP